MRIRDRVYYVSVTTVGGWATDWANDGVFGDGWHLFGIGTSSYEDAAAGYSRADQSVAAVDEDGNVTSVDIVDDEDKVIETVKISDSVVADAEKVVEAGEPDPAEYGLSLIHI